MILIASAAYIDQDLSAEVGLIPPSFLPIGNKRLYEYQIAYFSEAESEIYISLPASFLINESDRARILELNATIIFVPDGMSLGESVLYSWNASGKAYSRLTILHGDTLFSEKCSYEKDVVSIFPNKGAYHRAVVCYDDNSKLVHLTQSWVNDSRQVLTGLFNFTNPQYLMKCIVESKNNFVHSLQKYANDYSVACEKINGWLDFGHLNSFFSSRTAMTTQRIFNDLEINGRRLTKKSKDTLKMRAESNWFDSLPRSLSIHTPPLVEPYNEVGEFGCYTIEYLYLLPLSDLFVFGNHSVDTWSGIFQSAYKLLKEFSVQKRHVNENFIISNFNSLYLDKTLDRLSVYATQCNSNVDGLIELAVESSKYIEAANSGHCSIVHGDFCFSNILYDSRTQSLKLIDPRGVSVDKEMTILGDVRYDIAKFFHSAVGCYDLIIAGRFKLVDGNISFYDEEKLSAIEDAFDEVFITNNFLISKSQLLAINIHLFLSMLPLHSDRPDRQCAMIANAKRLFSKLDKVGAL